MTKAAVGDAPSSDRTFREALDLYRAIGATGHAERLARDVERAVVVLVLGSRRQRADHRETFLEERGEALAIDAVRA